MPDAPAASLEGFLGAAVVESAAVAADERSGCAGLPTEGYARDPVGPGTSEAALRLPAIHLVSGPAERRLSGTRHGAVGERHPPAHLGEDVFRFDRRPAERASHGLARLVEQAVRTGPATHRATVAGAASASSSWRGSKWYYRFRCRYPNNMCALL